MPEFRPLDSSDGEALVGIWNAACGPDLKTTVRFVQFNTQPPLGAVQVGLAALQKDQPVGFILASALPQDSRTSSPEMGWIDALATQPDSQRQGLGSALLAWAEQWLIEQGCTGARLGGSLRPFVAGYPVELGQAAFFCNRSYADRAEGTRIWDVARDLGDDAAATQRVAPADPKEEPAWSFQVRPAQAGDENALLAFMEREFPDRWRFEYLESLRMHGRLSDWLVLLTSRGMDGFAHLTFEDSRQPIERFYPYRLPRPWGQLGPLGVSRDLRGRGYGGALVTAALQRLREHGVRGAVIDWTSLLDFYARFGFQPFREYRVLIKRLR